MNSKNKIQGKYFSGNSSKGEDVFVEFLKDSLKVNFQENKEEIFFRSKEYKIIFPVGRKPFKVYLDNGGCINFSCNAKAEKILKNHNSFLINVISTLESKYRYIFILIAGAVFSLLFIYLYGLPILVNITKPLFPRELKLLAGNNAIKLLEKTILKKSNIGTLRQKIILKEVKKFVKKINFEEKIDLSFKQSTAFGANAVAILPNKIILTDDLVKLLKNEEIIAVIAHELSHLHLDHGSEVLLRQAYVSVISLFIIGGEPGNLHALSMALLEASYSRAQEKESDILALKYLTATNRDPELLARALKKLYYKQKSKEDSNSSNFEKYISTHPGIEERIKYISNY